MPSGFQVISVTGQTKIYNIYSYTLCGLLELVEHFAPSREYPSPYIISLIKWAGTLAKMLSGVVATSLHMRDKDLELWLVHLASLIGCMSNTGVSDPVNVQGQWKRKRIKLAHR